MIKIQIPTYDHIDQIRELNRNYLITHLTDAQKQNGFIRIEYDREELKQIIANKEIVIATSGEKVIGYYLIGRNSGNAALDYHIKRIFILKDLFNIEINSIGYGLQVCIHENYRNLFLFNSLFIKLSEIVNYKYLFGSITIDNKKSIALHKRLGFNEIGYDNEANTIFYIKKI